VRVIVLYSPVDEWDEKEWLHAAALSPAFDFLKDQKVFMAGLPQVLMDNGEGFSTCAIFNQDK